MLQGGNDFVTPEAIDDRRRGWVRGDQSRLAFDQSAGSPLTISA